MTHSEAPQEPVPHNCNVHGSIPDADLCFMSYPSFYVSCLFLHFQPSNKGRNVKKKKNSNSMCNQFQHVYDLGS